MDNFKRITIGILAAVIAIAGYWLWRATSASKQSSTDPVVNSLLSIQQSLDFNSPILPLYRWPQWINETDQRIPIKGSDFSLGGTETEYTGKFADISSENVDRVFLEGVREQITNAFTANSFERNETNSYPEGGDGLVTIIDAFERDDIKCVASYYESTDPFATIMCGTYDLGQAAWQQELSPAINPENDPDAIVSVRQILDNHAIGDVHSRFGGGYYWLAVKENGQWRQVFAGQDVAPCSLVDEHQFHRDIYENCYDERSDTLRFPEDGDLRS